jgi:hypothetical protein
MDIPGGAASERVVGKFGPGQPRDVLNTLLNGSKFDYVLLGMAGNPGAVQKVILTPRQSSGANPNAAAQNNNSAASPQPDDEQQPDESPVPDTAEMENQNPDQPPPAPGANFRRMMPGGQQGGEPTPAANNGDPQNGAKTPEQLMQELQQMQQQQQQYQQQLNPANQNQPQ